MSAAVSLSTSSPVIETGGLTKIYMTGKSRVQALGGIDLSVQPGEFIALMGASGCGKSTLLHLLGCLDAPSAGWYRLEGRDVSSLSSDARARLRSERIGFVFQSFNLLPRLNALENTALPLYYRKTNFNPLQRARLALGQVGLAERASHLPSELSGGERQRVAIARALVVESAVILADEPTGSLDSVTGAEVLQLLVQLWQGGRTILLVTHDPAVAAHARRIIRMKDGRIVEEG